MGSGVLLAILVALWFIVLVPMVVTRGDLASTPAEPTRVLRRRSDRSAMSSRPMSSRPMSSSARSSGARSDTGEAENMLTEPIPVLPRRTPGATLSEEALSGSTGSAGKGGAVVAELGSDAPVRDKATPTEIDIRIRRRRMLTGLVVLAVLWALCAAFWQPVLWWPQVVLDLVIFSYLVFLRLEAQREQDRYERRRARAIARVKLPEDRTQRLVRRHKEYQGRVTAATEHQAISLDDDDPSFVEMPTWQPAAPSEPAVDEATYWSSRKAV